MAAIPLQDHPREGYMSSEDLQTLIQLTEKYGMPTMAVAMQVVRKEINRNSTSTESSVRSAISSVYSTWDGSGNRSKASSVYSEALHLELLPEPTSAPKPDPAGLNPSRGRRSAAASPLRTRPPSVGSRAADSPLPAAADKDKKYSCPYCHPYGNIVHFGKKFDCRRHIGDFHCTNTLWECSQPDCNVVFESKYAYTYHMKTDHSHTSAAPKEVKVELELQKVFACGFSTCKELFELEENGDWENLVKRFHDHVARHFEERMPVSVTDWDYSTEVQNLLRQRALKDLWKEYATKEVRSALRWHPRSSCEFKKILECRSWEDEITAVRFAAYLGSIGANSSPLSLPLTLPRPALNRQPRREALAAISASQPTFSQTGQQPTSSNGTPISPTGPFGVDTWSPQYHSGAISQGPTVTFPPHAIWTPMNSLVSTQPHEAWAPHSVPMVPEVTYRQTPPNYPLPQVPQVPVRMIAADDPNQGMGAAARAAKMLRPKTPLAHFRTRQIQDASKDKRRSIIDTPMGDDDELSAAMQPPYYHPPQAMMHQTLPMHSGNAARPAPMMNGSFYDDSDYSMNYQQQQAAYGNANAMYNNRNAPHGFP